MILVTGANGRVGRELVQLLGSRGYTVRALVRDAEKGVALSNARVEIAVGDAARPETLAGAFRGADRLFLLTAAEPRQVEIQGHVIQAARRAGVRHVVKISVFGAALDSPSVLGRWHAETEAAVAASGMAWTHLRPQYFMQNLLGFARAIEEEHLFQAPLGAGRVAMVDARDVAAVAAAVLTGPGHEGRTYDITGPEAVSFADVAARVSEVTDRPVQYVDVAPEAARRGMLAAGLPEWMAAVLLEVYAAFRAGHGAATTDSVLRLTGREPRSLMQYLREHAFTFGA